MNKNKEYLLSVLIPTKNREKYLLGSIEQILKIGDKRIQIVIQDNSDISVYESLKETLLLNNNIKYNYKGGVVSFVENFDIGLQLCDGEYVCLIGDDDGIMPQIIPVVEWAKRNNKKIIKPSLNVYYFWPESNARKGQLDNGCLRINNISAKIRKYETKKELEKLLKYGCQDYLLLGIGKLYHGIVKKESLDKIKERTGKYFGGLTPDIYIATALSIIEDEVIEIDYPLTLPGVCKGSGSSDSASGKHTGLLEEAPHFKGHKSYEWSELVPKFYSVETIWADSSLAALKDLKEDELIGKFNLEFLTLDCLKKYSEYKKIILDNYKKNSINKKIPTIKVFEFTLSNLRKLVKRIRNKTVRTIINLKISIAKKEPLYCEISNIKNISEAVEKVNEKLYSNNFQVEFLIKKLDETNF